ncbi:MAG: DUF3795 domain-containing protein [Defluviitaleaceae bacterium]|nr:DUF3795 domain-containing protein [Defluviitaleaceae bacterium]
MDFCEERGLGYCGFACVVCSFKDCPGCAKKIADGDECAVGRCAAQKGVDGCYACPDYPCDKELLKNKRNKAFNRYAREFGTQELIKRLQINHKNGIMYHKPNNQTGDYDVLETEEEIYQLLAN